MRDQNRAIVWAVLGAALVYALLTVSRGPAWCDEVFYAEVSRVLAAEGRWAAPVFAGLRGLDQHFFLQPPVAFIERASILKVLGFGQLQERWAGVAEYLLTAWLLSRLLDATVPSSGRRRWLIAGATFLFLFDFPVLQTRSGGRPDFLASALMVASAVALVHASRRGGAGRYLAAGLLLGTGGMAHLSVLFAAPAAAWSVGFPSGDGRPNRQRWRAVLAFCGGVVLPLAGWVLMVADAPRAFVEQFLPHVTGAVGYVDTPGSQHRRLVAGIIEKFAHFKLLPLGGLSLLALLPGLHRCRGTARIPVLYCLSFVPLVFASRDFLCIYIPFFYACGALSLDQAMTDGWAVGRGKWIAVAGIALVLSYLPYPIARALAERRSEPARLDAALRAWVRANVPSGAPVIGDPDVYFQALSEGDRFYYRAPMEWLEFPLTSADIEAFDKRMREVKPRFAILPASEGDAPLKPLQATSARQIAHFQKPGGIWGPLHTPGLDLVIWEIRYRG